MTNLANSFREGGGMRVAPLTKFSTKAGCAGLDRISGFRGGCLEREEFTFFRGVAVYA